MRALTSEILLREALYCTSPTGVQQLRQHLNAREITFADTDLMEMLARLISSNRIVVGKQRIGDTEIQLFSLPGHGLGSP